MWLAPLVQVLLLAAAAPPAGGQPPAAAPVSSVPIFYSREARFAIPYHLNRPARTARELAEVQLYFSTNGGGAWQFYSKVDPTSGRFLFRAPSDGEYWFTVRTVDRAGQSSSVGAKLRAVDRGGRYHAAQSATHRPPRLDRRDRRALASRGASSQAGQPVAAISRLRHDALAGGQVRPSPAGRSRPAAERRSRSLPPRRGYPVGTPRRSARPGRQCGSGAGEDQFARPGAAGFAAGLTARLTARHRLDSDDAVAAGRP